MIVNKTKIRRNLVEFCYRCGLGNGTFVRSNVQAENIKGVIKDKIPYALGRIGINEINGFLMYNGDNHPSWVRYEPSYIPKSLFVNVGVFPNEIEIFRRWGSDYCKVNQQCDTFAVYLNTNEIYYFRRYLNQKCTLTRSWVIHPMLSKMNWLEACEGKKILVISQNINAIKRQLNNKCNVWGRTDFMLPDAEYKFVRPSFSPSVDPSNQSDSWFVELQRMKDEMDEIDYDIALVAAGGYANFLAVHAKNSGKIGINMGGALDPLFGIKTKRYILGGNAMPTSFMNEHWIAPLPEDKPKGANEIEDACYW